MKYAYFASCSDERAVNRLCRLFGGSRSGYYRWLSAAPNRYREANRALRERVEDIHYAHQQAYGTRRIRAVLDRQGYTVGRQRIAAAKRFLGSTPSVGIVMS